MKHLALYFLLVAMFILTGCPVLTKNTIDDGSCEVPAWLPGVWHEMAWQKSSFRKTTEAHLIKEDNKKGNLKCYDVDIAGKVQYDKVRQLVLSNVAGKTFLCVFNPGSNTGSNEGYYIYELRYLSDSEIVLRGIKENKINFNASSNEIFQFLVENKDNQDIYNDVTDNTTFRRYSIAP